MNPEQNRTEQNKPEKTSGRKKPSRELTKQEEFIKNHRRHHHEIASWRTVIFVLFLALWEISAGCGWIDSFFFSSPSRVARCFADQLRNNSMLSHIGVTLFETLLSLFIVWLGTGTKTIIVAGMSVAVFGSIISFYTGFQQVDAEKITLVYTLGGSKRDAFFKVVFPGSIPILLSTAKVNIGLALVGVIIGEFLAARRGLGYLIIYGSQVFQLDMVITSIIILCIIALGFYKSVQVIEHQIKKRFKM